MKAGVGSEGQDGIDTRSLMEEFRERVSTATPDAGGMDILTSVLADRTNALIVVLFELRKDEMQLVPVAYSFRPLGHPFSTTFVSSFVLPPFQLLKNPMYYKLWKGEMVLDQAVMEIDSKLLVPELRFLLTNRFKDYRMDLFPIIPTGPGGELEQFLTIIRRESVPIDPWVEQLWEAARYCAEEIGPATVTS